MTKEHKNLLGFNSTSGHYLRYGLVKTWGSQLMRDGGFSLAGFPRSLWRACVELYKFRLAQYMLLTKMVLYVVLNLVSTWEVKTRFFFTALIVVVSTIVVTFELRYFDLFGGNTQLDFE